MSTTNWSLRLARAADADVMPGIEQAAATKAFAGEASIDPARTRSHEDYARLIRKGHCLVAHVGEAMAGFLAAQPFSRELHIWEMDVAPAFQRRGIGSGLVRAAMIDARNTGFKALTLTTFRDLAWNAPFYARLGFDEVTALDAHPRLAGELANEVDDGLPADRRCAMICFLD
ncbi:N-acetyltransferase [Porphyrobacter sp. TH134]|uniref:GNAT family N-acetyltransferase n=1 Tax=Porphyrobacter sp. TH134 TaxID=2067450 RepID=UPI000C7BC36E|nr:GNAT family N-acetyltransferase [Porphyrobacter sp. TH134]PLK23024.1 N-acetyltransferase [Porphyrobacter sp. TH134]